MNLNAIGLGPIVPERLPERVATETPPSSGHPGSAPEATPHGDTSALSTNSRVASPKADADTELWGMLSREERGFYLRHGMKGQATYRPEAGPVPAGAQGARLGVRIDMRI